MNDGLKISDVEKLTGIPARRIKVYIGNATGRNRYFKPSGQLENGKNRNKYGESYTKAWLFNKTDVEKIKFIYILEQLDFKPERIREIMSQPDYTAAIDFDNLLEQLDQKITLFQGLKQFVSNIKLMGKDYLNTLIPVKTSALLDFLMLSQQRYGNQINSNRFAHLTDDEIIQAEQEWVNLFKRASHAINMPLDSPEVQQLACDMDSFIKTYFESATPYRMVVEFSMPRGTSQSTRTFDDEYGEGTSNFVASIAAMAFYDKLEEAINRFQPFIHTDPKGIEVVSLAAEYLEMRYSLFTGKLDATFCLPDFLTGEVLLPEHEADEPETRELFSYFNLVLTENYLIPLRNAIYDLANTRNISCSSKERHSKATILLGHLNHMFGESPYKSIKWLKLAFTEFDTIKTPIDQVAGDGASAFIGEALEDCINDMVSQILNNTL